MSNSEHASSRESSASIKDSRISPAATALSEVLQRSRIENPLSFTIVFQLMSFIRASSISARCAKVIYRSEEAAGFSWDHHDKLDYDRLQHYVQTDRALISADPVERPAKTTRKNHEMPTDLAVTVRAGTA